MKKINVMEASQLLMLAGIHNPAFETGSFSRCYSMSHYQTAKASSNEPALHDSMNGFNWSSGIRKGFITTVGLCCEYIQPESHLREFKILPFAGSFSSVCHQTFMSSRFPINRGIKPNHKLKAKLSGKQGGLKLCSISAENH